jgi:hypothetical protein
MLNRYRFFSAVLLAVGVTAGSACASPLYASRGYREGLSHGRNDARSGRSFSYERDAEYRDGDRGYRREYGDRNEYRRSFRQGFQAGYTEAFDRIATTFPRTTPYPSGARPRVYQSPAVQVGYRDGLEAGRRDARNRDRFDPERSSRYRSGDHEYDRRYGSKDDYKREYRAAFARGYQDGFTGARS